MTTKINNKNEKQQENEKKQLYIKDLEQFEKELLEKEIEQGINYEIEFSKQIHDLAEEIINEYINKNFKYEKGDIVLRKKSKLNKEWAKLITKMYYYAIINYDFEKKKFIIHLE